MGCFRLNPRFARGAGQAGGVWQGGGLRGGSACCSFIPTSASARADSQESGVLMASQPPRGNVPSPPPHHPAAPLADARCSEPCCLSSRFRGAETSCVPGDSRDELVVTGHGAISSRRNSRPPSMVLGGLQGTTRTWQRLLWDLPPSLAAGASLGGRRWPFPCRPRGAVGELWGRVGRGEGTALTPGVLGAVAVPKAEASVPESVGLP